MMAQYTWASGQAPCVPLTTLKVVVWFHEGATAAASAAAGSAPRIASAPASAAQVVRFISCILVVGGPPTGAGTRPRLPGRRGDAARMLARATLAESVSSAGMRLIHMDAFHGFARPA